MHGAIKLVGPRRVRKNALDSKIEFGRGLLFSGTRQIACRPFFVRVTTWGGTGQ